MSRRQSASDNYHENASYKYSQDPNQDHTPTSTTQQTSLRYAPPDRNTFSNSQISTNAPVSPAEGTQHHPMGPGAPMHPPSQGPTMHVGSGYGDPRWPLPLEARPPVRVDTGMLSFGTHYVAQQSLPPPYIINQPGAQPGWHYPPRGHSHHEFSPEDIKNVLPSHTPPLASTSPMDEYSNSERGRPHPSPEEYTSVHSATQARYGQWQPPMTAPDADRGLSSSYTPSPVESDTAQWTRAQAFEQSSTACQSRPRGGSSASESQSASESDSSPNPHTSSIPHGAANDRRSSVSPGSSKRAASGPKRKNKMHSCPICEKQFPRPSGLATHMNSHTGEKPYNCSAPGCDKTFAVRSNAKRHLKTHGAMPSPEPSAPTSTYAVEFGPHVVSHSHGSAGFPHLRWMEPGPTTRSTNEWQGSVSGSPSGSDADANSLSEGYPQDPSGGHEDIYHHIWQ